MGLFSKIFGSTGEETGEAPEGEAAAPEPHAEERAVSKSGAPGHDAVHAGTPPARIANGGTLVINEPRPNQAAAAHAVAPATQRGGVGAARAGARPAVSANVEARVHTQTMQGSPMVAVKNDPPPSPQAQQRNPAKRASGDVTPSPPPAQAGPPPKPQGASRGPTPPTSKAPAKKIIATATLPLGGHQAPPPKPPGSNGAAPARTAEALVLDPIGAAAAPAPARRPADADEVDSAFDRIAPAAGGARGLPGSLTDDAVTKAENARLFSQMVVGHAQPLREFMLDLGIGQTTKQWLDVARPAADAILKGAVALEQKDLAAALRELGAAFEHAARAAGSKIGKTDRSAIVAAYGKLASLLPSAFEVKGDRDRREPLVVHHLLLQIPGVQKVTLDKLYGAGLASLESLCRASAEDLVAIGRVEEESAHAIVRRFQAYWRERAEEPLVKAENKARHKLKELVSGLAKAHTEFQAAEASEDRERKRRARNERRERALAMNVLLAQLGEVDLVEELERSPTERRIERVRSYIEHTSASNP